MHTTDSTIQKNANIVIVGAGPAGLSTAWFLAKNGFHNVTVLEKLGRVGGLCKSITVGGRSFDIGANYLTWAYTETLEIAKEVGADTYPEKPYTSLKIDDGLTRYKFRDIKKAVLYNYYTNQKVSIFAFLVATFRYLWIRWKLARIIDVPGYLDTIHEQENLCVSFKDWLSNNKLMALSAMFQFPITVMGYGKLEDIATPYALRYMSLRTVIPMVFSSWLLHLFIGHWPKRFVTGFQRLWERVAWKTNVRLNVNITKIERHTPENKIRVTLEYPEQHLNKLIISTATHEYDYLILACPLTPDTFEQLGLETNHFEKELSSQILVNPYCMTTYWVDKLQMPQPIAPVIPIPQEGIPWAIARQFQDYGNMFTQFYTCPARFTKSAATNAETYNEVDNKVRQLVALLGGDIDENQAHWHTFDTFTYFQHFSVNSIKAGIYATLAKMQGHDRTYYVGGATDFELIEPIVNHSKYIVEKHFPGQSSSHNDNDSSVINPAGSQD